MSGRIARWQMILTEYDIQYTTQKAIKGSVLADHLAHQAVDDYQSMNFEFPDESIMVVTGCEVPGPDEGPEEGSRWSMHFDGASNALGHGIGAVHLAGRFITPGFGSSQRNVGNSATIWHVAYFRVLTQITNENNLVYASAGHVRVS